MGLTTGKETNILTSKRNQLPTTEEAIRISNSMSIKMEPREETTIKRAMTTKIWTEAMGTTVIMMKIFGTMTFQRRNFSWGGSSSGTKKVNLPKT